MSNKRRQPRQFNPPPRDTEDPYLDPQWNAYVTRVRSELVPKIEGSTIGVSIVPTRPEDVDIKFAVELGLMIMMDKPLIMVVRPNQVLPEHLRRVADEIVVYDPEHPDAEALHAAMKRVGVDDES